MKGHYRPYKEEDISTLADTMCQADVTEIFLSDGLDPLKALQRACRDSEEINTIVAPDGELLGMFGLSNIDDITAAPWMLTSGKLQNYYRQFLRESKQWVIDANERKPLLLNYVHVDNKNAMLWLKFLGFKFVRLVKEYGVGKAPFYEFVRMKDVCTSSRC